MSTHSNNYEEALTLIMATLRSLEAFKSQRKGNDTRQQIEDDDMTKFRKQLDQKVNEMDVNNASTETNSHVFNNVMKELEQENLELTSLLKISEESRTNLEGEIIERNKEIKTLQTNKDTVFSLEDKRSNLISKNIELNDSLTAIGQGLATSRKKEYCLVKKLNELNVEVQEITIEATGKIVDLSKKLTMSEEQLLEQESIFTKTETTLRELLATVQQMGDSNNEIKTEFKNCILTGKNLKEANQNLHYCKDYLEEQVDRIVDNLKQSRKANEKLKLELANLSADKQNHSKQSSLLNEKVKSNKSEIPVLKHQIDISKDTLETYESGDVKSGIVMNEINKVRQMRETENNLINNRIADRETEIRHDEEGIRIALVRGKRLDTKVQKLNQVLKDFQDSYVEKHELSKIAKDYEVKHKMDFATHRTKAKSILNNSASNVINTVKDSLA